MSARSPMFELVGAIPYSGEEPNETMFARPGARQLRARGC